MAAVYGDGLGDLRVEIEQVDVTTNLPTADERWTYTDQQGHEHHWRDGYPTLTWIVDETHWCEDCGEEHYEGHFECPACGEAIVPDQKPPDTFRRFAPGRKSYSLNGEPISEERALQIMAARQQ